MKPEKLVGREQIIWKAICRAYEDNPNAFLLGAGRDTVGYLVSNRKNRRYEFAHSDIRNVLNKAARLGWMQKITEPRRCTRFIKQV
jgi:hypothetical protein